MQTNMFRNSRFQTYGLVIILILASASIGALSAIYLGPAVGVGTTRPVMLQAAPALEPAAAPQQSSVTDTVEESQRLRELDNMPPARAADVARWVAMGEAYTQRDVANMQPAGAADVARWVEMGNAYAHRELDNMRRARDADVARWVAMGEAYKQRIPPGEQ